MTDVVDLGPDADAEPDVSSTDDGLARRLAELSPDKRALLEQRLKGRRQTTADLEPPAIVPRQDEGPAPLSYLQELLWLLQELSPEALAYNSSGARRLRGPLDVRALEAALRGVVGRHEALRTTFEMRDEGPVQIVRPDVVAELEIVPAPGADEEEISRLVRAQVRQAFDLRRLPLFRMSLLEIGEQDHVLLMVAHHITWDGWSKGIFFRELAEIYDALCAGREPDLPDVPLHYADFAVWQRAWLQGAVLDRELGYWREHLRGAPPLLALPTDRRRPAVQAHRGDRLELWIDAEIYQGLTAFSRAQGITPFMALTAVWVTLLNRYTGQDDIVVGTPIAGRTREEVRDLIGFFTNTLALRVDLSGDPTFTELLERVRKTALGGFAHQEVPFELVVREVSAQRDLSYSPVFQSLVVLQNAAREEDLALRGLDLDMVVTSSGTAKFDLSLGMGEYQGRLHASFEYDTDLFDRETVERVRDHFATLLHEVVADPSRRLSELPLLTAEAERDLVTVWNTTDGPVADQPLHALFVDRARVAPDAVAVRVQGAELTYADVDRRSDSLAAHLRAQGVDVGSFVGLCSERSLDMVVGLLAILKAGAACVPLDPAYPRERLRFMVQDTGAAVVLAERGLRELVEDLGVEPLLLDEERPDLEADPVDVDADALAYVIYTSGSTGAPKGVLLDHRGLANHAQAMIRRFGFTDADRVLQFASISFDISLEEIFCTLLSGGTLVLRGEDFPLAGPALLAWLERERITVMDLPTAFWHEWVRDLDEGHMRAHAGLRLVIVGGEKAQAGAYATWRTVADPGVRWVNTYGPTEASVVATAYEPPPAGIDAGRDMPIGRPLDNVRVYVLDSRRRPVPLGVQGELYVAGAGVARGYLHRPEETGARFVALPFNGERAYRTGDVVRQLPSGDLEFLGRTDQQIKLRGYRIEPGEIETMLAEHDLVSTALVMLREDDGREPALVAYVAAERGAADTLDDELRRWLGGRLPGYAVPSAVVVLEEFPLSPNGKVDRAALPAPDAGAPSELARPRDEVETAIAGIWEELLGHPVGIHDNFFEAGGHSLLAVRMFSLLRSRLNVPLPLAVLIQAPTVAELATVVRGDAASDGSHFDLVVPLKEEGARSPLWLIHELRGDLLCYRDLVRRLDDDQPAYGIQAVGLSGEAAPLSRIEDMASRYLEEVRARQPEGPYLFAGLCFGGTIAYEMAHQLEQQGGDVALVGLIDAAPFGLRGRITTSQRSRRHLQELLVLPRGNRLPFLMETSRHLGERVRRHVWWFVSKRLFLDRGRALPGLLHDMLAVNSVAAALYSTPKYGGRVTVFRAQRDDVEYQTDGRLRWADYAGGGVDVRDVASEGVEHLTLLTEPHVERLADALESAIVETLDDEG